MDMESKHLKESDLHMVSQHSIFCINKKKLYLRSAIIFFFMFNCGLFQLVVTLRPVIIGNERSHVRLLHSAVINGNFEINPDKTDVSYYNGKFYSNKPPGFAFILIPAYRIYTWLSGIHSIDNAFIFVKFSNIVFSSLSAVVVFLFLLTFKLSGNSVFFGLIAAILGTIFPAYTCLATSIPLSIFLFLISVFFLRLFYLKKEMALLWGVSLFASVYAVIVDYSNGFLLLPIFIMLFGFLRKMHIPYLLILALPLLLLVCYNYSVFDAPFVLSYSYYQPPSHVDWPGASRTLSLSHIPRGLYGLLLSPARGLFLLSPVTLLGVAAFIRILKDKRRDLIAIAATALTGILFISAYVYWHGGHCVGYRHIIPSAIILGILSSFFFEKSGSSIRSIAFVLLLFSCFTGIMSFFIQIDEPSLCLTWKAEPVDVHANFYTELLYPLLKSSI